MIVMTSFTDVVLLLCYDVFQMMMTTVMMIAQIKEHKDQRESKRKAKSKEGK